jgi:F0F1-type ATP synthase membrane subunit b/b'
MAEKLAENLWLQYGIAGLFITILLWFAFKMITKMLNESSKQQDFLLREMESQKIEYKLLDASFKEYLIQGQKELLEVVKNNTDVTKKFIESADKQNTVLNQIMVIYERLDRKIDKL